MSRVTCTNPWKDRLVTGIGEVLEVLLVFYVALLVIDGVMLSVPPCLKVLWR